LNTPSTLDVGLDAKDLMAVVSVMEDPDDDRDDGGGDADEGCDEQGEVGMRAPSPRDRVLAVGSGLCETGL
jgi:hypothetical protein